MIQEIAYLGAYKLAQEGGLNSRIKKLKITYEKGGQSLPKHIIKFCFNSQTGACHIDVKEQMKEKSVYEYLYVDKTAGPSAKRRELTHTNPQFAMVEVLSNWQSERETLKESWKHIMAQSFCALEDTSGRYEYLLNLAAIGMKFDLSKIILETAENGKPNYKKVFKKAQGILEAYIKKEYGLEKTQLGLYTILIDGAPLCQADWYIDYLKRWATSEDDGKESMGRCNICGRIKPIQPKIDMGIKFFVNDKLSFATGFDKQNLIKNLSICKSCYLDFKAGERFVQDQLKTNVGHFQAYIIPHFYFTDEFTQEEVFESSKAFKNAFNQMKNMEDIKKFEQSLREGLPEKVLKTSMLSFVFYKEVQASIKAQHIIKEVSPTIFIKMAKNFQIAANQTYKLYEGIHFEPKIVKGLNALYFSIPIREQGGNPAEYKYILSLYDAIFTGKGINGKTLISKWLKTLSIYAYGGGKNFNVSLGENENRISKMCYVFIQFHYLTFFFRGMNLLKEGETMNTEVLDLKEGLVNHIRLMGYDEQRAALFLMGYLMGKIGRKQVETSFYDKEKKDREGSYKPILNKINFNGMSLSRLIRLNNEIALKLKQFKILQYYEKELGALRQIFDLEMERWQLDHQKSAYYLMSGFSFGSLEKIERRKEDDDQQ